jgi:DNA-binding LacI/PurR family transcriptional regulator
LREAKESLVKSFTKMAASTLKDIARETGLAVSSVSYALRGAPNVPEATAARVKAAAERLGYRMNARVAELMAQVRRGRGASEGDRLALLWVEGRPARGLGRDVAEGAKARAAERGYGLEEFSLKEAGGNPRRLADILSARGIPGVVLGPVFDRAQAEMEWPWERFAMAVIGTAEWNAPLSRAAHHHYEAMRLALDWLRKAGARRPAAWLHAETNERAHRGWQAAWLAYGETGAAPRLWLAESEPTGRQIEAWLARVDPDAVVLGDAGEAARLKAAGWSGRVVTLDRRARSGMAGVDQGYETIAGHAVDLVVAQLQRNERGPPETPRALLFPGRWVERRA